MSTVKKNKFVLVSLVMTIILAGLTFGNLPGPTTPTGIQVIDGITYNFDQYRSVNHEMLAIFNYLDTIVSSDYQGYGEWNGWNADHFAGLHHYVLAFMAYATAQLFESTPGYRTDFYRNFAFDLIEKMNTSETEWGTNSIQYKEWTNPNYGFVDYYYDPANPASTSDTSKLYVGDFRGPANIMWTGHFALMEALYERNFNTGELTDEMSWFMNDWNTSLLTDGYGNPKDGGIWGTGLIPCEPYIVFVQCNSIPIFFTELYDNMYGTTYMEGGMWDYGLDFINDDMQDDYGLFTDGYYVMQPASYEYSGEGAHQQFPGQSIDRIVRDGRPKVSSYGTAWSLAFLEYTQPNASATDYPVFLQHYSKDISKDMMYMMDSYNNPGGFGTYDILGTMFSIQLAKQMGDFATRDRLQNFMYSLFNKVWSPDGRMLYYDTSSLEPFLQPVLSFGKIWSESQVSIRDLATPRSAEFWDYPYIGSADDDRIWVYQAEWDEHHEAFILSIKVDQTATLVFSNFESTPTAYASGISLGDLTPSGEDYTMTLSPGVYQLVIM
ncbi:MAG: hypothetical protein ACFFEJ_14875 [Candidatus Thorarchaeota archaeon]